MTKIIIDIPEEVVTAIQNGEDYRYDIHTAIAQGIPFGDRPKGECIPVKDLIGYIRTCREELFERMKEYEPKEFEIRDDMLTNFEQIVRLISENKKDGVE